MANSTTDHHCLLKLTNSTTFKKFLHECVDELVGKELKSDERYQNGLTDIEGTNEEHVQAKLFIQSLYKKNIFEEEFSPQLTDISNAHVEEIETCFNIRKKEIQQAVVKEQLLKSNIPLVENIDWKIKWVIGSSKLSSLSESLVSVDLNCVASDKSAVDLLVSKTLINFEMNLNNLDNFIKDLEQIKSQLEQVIVKE